MGNNGFLYQNDDEREREFRLATRIFKTYPSLNKISRKVWDSLLQSSNDPFFRECVRLGFDPAHPPKHSYFKQSDGTVLAFARGKQHEGLLGEGAFGRVKYASDKDGALYAMKVEKKDNGGSESAIAQDVRFMKGPKERVDLGNSRKYYSLFEYRGSSLSKALSSGTLTLAERVCMAKQLAWEVHQLHSGYLSKTGSGYAHHDIKPDNIVLNKKNQPNLIDFGFAESIHQRLNMLAGTPEYMPVSVSELNSSNHAPALARLSKMSSAEKDTFALKRTFYWKDGRPQFFSRAEFFQVSIELRRMLNTKDVDQAIARKDTPLSFAIALAAEEYQQDVSKALAHSSDHQECLYSALEILTFFQEVMPQKPVLDIAAMRTILFEANWFTIKLMMHQLTTFQMKYKHFIEDSDKNDPSFWFELDRMFQLMDSLSQDTNAVTTKVDLSNPDNVEFQQDLNQIIYNFQLNRDELDECLITLIEQVDKALNRQVLRSELKAEYRSLTEYLMKSERIFLCSAQEDYRKRYQDLTTQVFQLTTMQSVNNKEELLEKINDVHALKNTIDAELNLIQSSNDKQQQRIHDLGHDIYRNLNLMKKLTCHLNCSAYNWLSESYKLIQSLERWDVKLEKLEGLSATIDKLVASEIVPAVKHDSQEFLRATTEKMKKRTSLLSQKLDMMTSKGDTHLKLESSLEAYKTMQSIEGEERDRLEALSKKILEMTMSFPMTQISGDDPLLKIKIDLHPESKHALFKNNELLEMKYDLFVERKAFYEHPHVVILAEIYNGLKDNQIKQLILKEVLSAKKPNILDNTFLISWLNARVVIDGLQPDQRRSIRNYIIQHDLPNLEEWKKPIGLWETMQGVIKNTSSKPIADKPIASSTSTILKAIDSDRNTDESIKAIPIQQKPPSKVATHKEGSSVTKDLDDEDEIRPTGLTR